MKYFFYILMIAILGWFCFMQLFGANEQNYNDPSKSIIYSGSFYWNKEDGTKQKNKGSRNLWSKTRPYHGPDNNIA